MYNWRKLTAEQRVEVFARRRRELRPWHSQPHIDSGNGDYLLTAACYEHVAHLGYSAKRMGEFETELLTILDELSTKVYAWVILPNHYHAVVRTPKVKVILKRLGKLHGRTSFEWNGEENGRGRQVWCNCVETVIKSDRHLMASINYVHNNPVRHGYADKWRDWPFSSAQDFLDSVGLDKAAKIWKEYPVDTFGDEWDAPDL